MREGKRGRGLEDKKGKRGGIRGQGRKEAGEKHYSETLTTTFPFYNDTSTFVSLMT